MEVCPTEVIHAPVQHVWDLLTDPHRLAQWSGAKLDKSPKRPLRACDRFILQKYVHLPFGIVNHEQVQLTVLSTTACRVTFN